MQVTPHQSEEIWVGNRPAQAKDKHELFLFLHENSNSGSKPTGMYWAS